MWRGKLVGRGVTYPNSRLFASVFGAPDIGVLQVLNVPLANGRPWEGTSAVTVTDCSSEPASTVWLPSRSVVVLTCSFIPTLPTTSAARATQGPLACVTRPVMVARNCCPNTQVTNSRYANPTDTDVGDNIADPNSPHAPVPT